MQKILEALREAEEQNRWGGDEADDGSLGYGLVDWDDIRNRIMSEVVDMSFELLNAKIRLARLEVPLITSIGDKEA